MHWEVDPEQVWDRMGVKQGSKSSDEPTRLDYISELEQILDDPDSWCEDRDSAQERADYLYSEIASDLLDGLHRKLQEQHSKIGDIRKLWNAVSDARTKVSQAQDLIQESLVALDGISESGRMEALLNGVKMLDAHLGHNGIAPDILRHSITMYGPHDLTSGSEMTEDLLKAISEVHYADTELTERIRTLRNLCGRANSINNEIRKLRSNPDQLDEERLKDMGMLCHQLESSDSVLSEAALTTKLLSHMYEIEQIEAEFQSTRSRLTNWQNRIAELKNDPHAYQNDSSPGVYQSSLNECGEDDRSSTPTCPKCESRKVVKNGFRSGKQRYRCGDCSARFVR
jgi:chromosome segregation ATPase